jgi:hypothetical protein
MRAHDAYYVLHPPLGGGAHPQLHKHAADFLPKGITVEEAMRLGRVEFFMKLTEMFAAEITQLEGGLSPFANALTRRPQNY